MNQKELIIRQAENRDVPFLVETIIEAEKAGSGLLSWTTIFGLTEEDAKKYIARMLYEEIDGCELSVSSFVLAEISGKPAASLSGWIEGKDHESSSQLKGNLLSYVLPKECIKKAAATYAMLQDLHIDYTPGSVQKGAGYVLKEYRGQHLFGLLTQEIMDRALKEDPSLTSAFTQIYSTNIAAIKANEKLGFRVVKMKESHNPDIFNYVPSNKKLLLKKDITLKK